MAQLKSEMSRSIETGSIPASGKDIEIEATERERKAIAKRMGIISLESLKGKIILSYNRKDHTVEAEGRFAAKLTQECVVTLEPVPTEIKRGEIFALFAPAAVVAKLGAGSEEPDDELPEPINKDGTIDVGELMLQHLALAIDPYPRKPGAVFKPPKLAPVAKVHPFAKLKKLKDAPKKK